MPSGRGRRTWARTHAEQGSGREDDGATFEIVPVVPSRETRAVVAPFLNEG